jgi:HK97 family phage portal protein
MKKLFLKAITTLASGLGLTDPRLYSFAGGGPTYSGETVTGATAMQLDTVYACVRLKAQTQATIPLYLYKRDSNGRGVLAREHPLFALIHDRPNSDMTACSFWQCMVSSLQLWGNAYATIERRGDGTPIALTPLLPDRLTVRREPDGSLLYRYQGLTGPEVYTEDAILHIKGFTVDGLTGLSPIALARETLGIAQSIEKATGSFYRNSMRPSIVWTAPNFIHENQRKRAREIIDEFSGSINAGRVPLIEGGFKLDTLSINPQDAQLLASRQFSVEQICRIFNVPGVLIGHNTGQTAWGGGMEMLGQWFKTYGLGPDLRGVEQECNRSLLPPAMRSKYYFEYDAEALLRTDAMQRAQIMQTYVVNGLRTRNEVRELDNLSPMEGGDVLTVHAALIPVSDVGKIAQVPKEKDIAPGNTTEPPTQETNQALPGKPDARPQPQLRIAKE